MNKAQVRDPASAVKSPVASENSFLEDYLEGIVSKHEKVRRINSARTLGRQFSEHSDVAGIGRQHSPLSSYGQTARRPLESTAQWCV